MAASVSRLVSVIFAIFIVVTLSTLVYTHSHTHDHDHDHAHGSEQPAHFKYSRQANEDQGHGHSHGGHEVDEHENHEHGHWNHDDHLHEHHGHAHGDDHEDGHAHNDKKTSTDHKTKRDTTGDSGPMLWLKALGSTALISAAPVVILSIIPIENANERKPLLKVLLAFASGGLLGDAFLHLIPHALTPHDHTSEHGHTHSHSHANEDADEEAGHKHDMTVGLWVLAGIVVFLCVEKTVRCIKGDHSHTHGDSIKEKDEVKIKQEKKSSNKKESGKKDKKNAQVEVVDIKVSGYLNLAADFTHNFTDGLAIGASYRAGHTIGVITTVAVLLHEVPHEIGDFAILIQSGCSKKKAILLQLTTAVGAMLGTIISLLVEGGIGTATWVLPFTAGGFIYIATVSVIPELLEGETKLWQSVKEIVAMITGVVMMILIAAFE